MLQSEGEDHTQTSDGSNRIAESKPVPLPQFQCDYYKYSL